MTLEHWIVGLVIVAATASLLRRSFRVFSAAGRTDSPAAKCGSCMRDRRSSGTPILKPLVSLGFPSQKPQPAPPPGTGRQAIGSNEDRIT